MLAWLLRQFPIEPLPGMIVPIVSSDMLDFRERLGERFRALAVGE